MLPNGHIIIKYRNVLVNTLSHLFGISSNQAELARMKNFQNSHHIRERILNPSHTTGGMSRNDVGMVFFIILFPDMRFGAVLNYIRTHSRANRDVPIAFERQSKDSDGIRITFQLINSFTIEIDSGRNRDAFEVHSGSFETHSGHWQDLKWLKLAVSILPRMRSECFECCWNAVTARKNRMQSECC